jgi:transposase
VHAPQQYSAAETERMMKLQDVLLKAMAKKITWWDAAEIIGVTGRTMRRWRQRLEADGYSGLADRRKGKPSGQRVPVATVEEVLRLYQEVYADLNMRHFHEKLRQAHGIRLSYTWMQKALQGAGLVARRRKRGPHRRRDTSGGRCRACCCISTAASTAGWAMSAGTI